MTLTRRVGLKREAPLKRTTCLTSTTPLQRRTPLAGSRKPLPVMSARRREELPAREECKRIVRERDKHCRYPGCYRTICDVHELQGGAARHATYLDPAKCLLLCSGPGGHHRWAEEHPLEARALGLEKPGWEA